MTQAEMLANQWPQAEESTIFGFTGSDWYKDVKDVLAFGWTLNNADLITAPQRQGELMYSTTIPQNPNATYYDPRTQQQQMLDAQWSDSINPMYVVGGVLAVALLVALK